MIRCSMPCMPVESCAGNQVTWNHFLLGPKFHMSDQDPTPDLYCPNCAKPVSDPLVCGDCRAVICRICGTPLERVDELGIG